MGSFNDEPLAMNPSAWVWSALSDSLLISRSKRRNGVPLWIAGQKAVVASCLLPLGSFTLREAICHDVRTLQQPCVEAYVQGSEAFFLSPCEGTFLE